MATLQLMVLEDHPTPRQSTLIALKARNHRVLRAAASGWKAVRPQRRGAGIDICDDAPQLFVTKSLIKAWRLMCEVSSELHWMILQRAGMNGLQTPIEIGNLHIPSDIQRANKNHKHASGTSINSCFHLTSNEIPHQALAHPPDERPNQR